MTIERIAALLEKSGGADKNFPPTDLYNEGWMLRLVLDWFSLNQGVSHDLSFLVSDKWYSEALLPSAFLARYRGDKLAESWTHADGVIGDFLIGANRGGDLSLANNGSRILITEAKMFSKLSAGVTNAKYFNQAARNVACIAEVIRRAQVAPTTFNKLGFFVLAPESQINDGIFARHMLKDNIECIVNQRVSEYQEVEKEKWFTDWFVPTLEEIRIREISWEEIVLLIKQTDIDFGAQIETFYGKCLEFNRYVPNRFS